MDRTWMREMERQISRLKGRIEQRPISSAGAAEAKTDMYLLTVGATVDGYPAVEYDATGAMDRDNYTDALTAQQIISDGVAPQYFGVAENLKTGQSVIIYNGRWDPAVSSSGTNIDLLLGNQLLLFRTITITVPPDETFLAYVPLLY
jgi:hypothetical protein